VLDIPELFVQTQLMPEDEQLSIEILCDLIQRELQNSLEDLAVIREKRAQAKRRLPMLKTALANADQYLRDLETKM
jgi:predicted enzyme involved in methoxymalonyl-ACP biosynthesis